MSRRPDSARTRIEAQLQRVAGEIRRCDTALENTQRDRARLVDEQAGLVSELGKHAPRTVKVTEHAIVRYLERVRGSIDREALEAEIVTDELQGLVDKLGGSGTFPLRDRGFSVVLKDYHIITIKTPDAEGKAKD